jgi:hypothetical protein
MQPRVALLLVLALVGASHCTAQRFDPLALLRTLGPSFSVTYDTASADGSHDACTGGGEYPGRAVQLRLRQYAVL